MNQHQFEELCKQLPFCFWQSSIYANFQSSIGKKVYMIGDSSCFSLVIVQKKRYGTILELPYGPLGTPNAAFFEDIKNIAYKENALFSIVYGEKPLSLFPSNNTHFPQTTLIVDISTDLKSLLSQMKPKGRYNIRIAQRNRLIIQEGIEYLDDFYTLLLETKQRDGFGIHTKEYYKSFLENIKESKLIMVYNPDDMTPLSGAIILYTPEIALYYYGASSNLHRNKMAPYLVQWHAIETARSLHIPLYDFVGIASNNNPHDRLFGVTRFKTQFGGTITPLKQAYDIPHKWIQYLVVRFGLFIYALFTRIRRFKI